MQLRTVYVILLAVGLVALVIWLWSSDTITSDSLTKPHVTKEYTSSASSNCQDNLDDGDLRGTLTYLFSKLLHNMMMVINSQH